MKIDFDDFINQFYNNTDNKKLGFSIDDEDSNLYDVFHMLLDLFIAGIDIFNLDIYNSYFDTLQKLQSYFNNINIKVNVSNFSKRELTTSNLYENRYIRFESLDLMTINAAHKPVDQISEIRAFYLKNDTYNFCISFSQIYDT